MGQIFPLTIAQPRHRYDELAEVAWARSPPEHMGPTGNEVRAERRKHETPRERRETDMPTYDEIAKELGTSKSTLYRVTQQLKLRIGELDDAGKAKVREAIAAMPGRPGKRRGPAVALPGGLKRTPAQRRKEIEAAAERRERREAEEAPKPPRKRRPSPAPDRAPELCRLALAALWPDGVEPEQYAEAVRVVLAMSCVEAEVRP